MILSFQSINERLTVTKESEQPFTKFVFFKVVGDEWEMWTEKVREYKASEEQKLGHTGTEPIANLLRIDYK